MDQQETLTMNFIAAAQSEVEPAIIYLSSDEDGNIECLSADSVEDLVSSSDEESGNSANGEVYREATGRPCSHTN